MVEKDYLTRARRGKSGWVKMQISDCLEMPAHTASAHSQYVVDYRGAAEKQPTIQASHTEFIPVAFLFGTASHRSLSMEVVEEREGMILVDIRENSQFPM